MARALLMSPQIEATIKAAVEEARKNPTSLEETKASAMPLPQVGELKLSDRPPGYKAPMASVQVLIPVGFRAAISFEEQPGGLCRHLSISVRGMRGKMPGMPAVLALCAQFGVNWDESKKWVEEYEPGRYAINIVSLDSDADKPNTASAYKERLDDPGPIQ